MPQLITVKEHLYQPLWSGWRMGFAHSLLKDMNLFVGSLGNVVATNAKTAACLVSDRSALISRIGVFASFDNMEDYEEFWLKGSLDFIMNGRLFHELNMSEVEVPDEHERLKSGLPKPTHEYGYFGWFTFELPLEIAPRSEFFVQLHSSDELVRSMESLWYGPYEDFGAITVFLDTEMIREVQ